MDAPCAGDRPRVESTHGEEGTEEVEVTSALRVEGRIFLTPPPTPSFSHVVLLLILNVAKWSVYLAFCKRLGCIGYSRVYF